MGRVRFIPAGAGNAGGSTCSHAATSVHPRRRGERRFQSRVPAAAFGSSPQARGTHRHGRRDAPRRRFIPAGAGNAAARLVAVRETTVHPRRRGERDNYSRHTRVDIGSSPQARGTPPWRQSAGVFHRFIPAGAGNARRIAAGLPESAVHPRRRGERCAGDCPAECLDGSSPQARGTPWRLLRPGSGRRFIPAGAGNARCRSRSSTTLPVHPRRRGERLEQRR